MGDGLLDLLSNDIASLVNEVFPASESRSMLAYMVGMMCLLKSIPRDPLRSASWPVKRFAANHVEPQRALCETFAARIVFLIGVTCRTISNMDSCYGFVEDRKDHRLIWVRFHGAEGFVKAASRSSHFRRPKGNYWGPSRTPTTALKPAF